MLYVNPQLQSGFKAIELRPGAKSRETEALKQYEQLFLFQMLKEMRKTVPDYGFFDSGGQKAYFEEMMDDFLAGEMASSGQLGVARQMAQQLNAREQTPGAQALESLVKAGIPVSRELKGIALPGDETNGIEAKRDSVGITLQPIHPGGISLSRAHESYRNNE
jgi:Rod binding domain-containing protein